jgi:hypothetical protein
MPNEIDFELVHNEACELFAYLKNFIHREDAHEQIFEEIDRSLHKVAFNEGKKLQAYKSEYNV